MRAYFQIFFAFIFSFLSACTDEDKLADECYTPAGCSPQSDTATEGDTDTDSDSDADTDADSDTDTDTDTDSDTDADADTDYVACLAEAFHGTDQTYGGTIDDGVAELSEITSFPSDGWNWVDAEVARIMDASDGSGFETDLRIPQSGLCGGSQDGGTMYVAEVEDSEKSDPDNGLIITIQPDGTWVEINQYRECDDGTAEGWKLPGGNGEALSICGDSAWGSGYGGHGGSHLPILPGMVTIEDVSSGNLDWGHVLHVEVDNSILGCPSDVCYVEPAKTADTGASANYHGTEPMGAWWKVDSDYDCTAELVTYYAQAWCETSKRGLIPVDRSNESDDPEIQFVIENGVDAIVQSIDGESLFNNNGQIAIDFDTLFEVDENGVALNIHRVTNPSEAYNNYAK